MTWDSVDPFWERWCEFEDQIAHEDAELERLHRHGPALPGVGEHIELMDELDVRTIQADEGIFI